MIPYNTFYFPALGMLTLAMGYLGWVFYQQHIIMSQFIQSIGG